MLAEVFPLALARAVGNAPAPGTDVVSLDLGLQLETPGTTCTIKGSRGSHTKIEASDEGNSSRYGGKEVELHRKIDPRNRAENG